MRAFLLSSRPAGRGIAPARAISRRPARHIFLDDSAITHMPLLVNINWYSGKGSGGCDLSELGSNSSPAPPSSRNLLRARKVDSSSSAKEKDRGLVRPSPEQVASPYDPGLCFHAFPLVTQPLADVDHPFTIIASVRYGRCSFPSTRLLSLSPSACLSLFLSFFSFSFSHFWQCSFFDTVVSRLALMFIFVPSQFFRALLA